MVENDSQPILYDCRFVKLSRESFISEVS